MYGIEDLKNLGNFIFQMKPDIFYNKKILQYFAKKMTAPSHY